MPSEEIKQIFKLRKDEKNSLIGTKSTINLLKDSPRAPAYVELLLELNRLQMHIVIHIGDRFSFQHLYSIYDPRKYHL